MTIDNFRDKLPASASEITRGLCGRYPADPIGMGPIPSERSSLDFLVEKLCKYLKNLNGSTVNGKHLSLELFNEVNTRALRLLVAYARVYHHIKEIVGVPGSGYAWANLQTERGQKLLTQAILQAKQMGRCFFFIAANHKHDSTAMTAAQMVFDWFKSGGAISKDEPGDELSALVNSQGIGVADMLEALVELMGETPDGREALYKVGERHGDLLLPRGVAKQLKAAADEMSRMAEQLNATLAQTQQAIPTKQEPARPQRIVTTTIVHPAPPESATPKTDAEKIVDDATKPNAGGLF